MRLALCQTNPTPGALDANVEAMLDAARRAASAGADLAVFPELSVTGYGVQDLLFHPAFLADVERAVARLRAEAPAGLALLFGAPLPNPDPAGKRLLNAALLVEDGAMVGTVVKQLLPTYNVFDEGRYFAPGPPQAPLTFRGVRLGVNVCEDMWNEQPDDPAPLYAATPIADLARQGVDVFVNLSASLFAYRRIGLREGVVQGHARRHGRPFVFVNQVGANGEFAFDGQSGVWDAAGRKVVAAPAFEAALALWDVPARDSSPAPEAAPGRDDVGALLDALVLGVRDYFAKQPFFPKALLGLSGGIDSALTAAIACLALGPDRVVGVTMPSRYSSSGSVDDSAALAEALGIEFHRVPIVPAVEAFGTMLGEEALPGGPSGVTEENLQARARAVVLMALSNAYGHLVLTTGNKSETAVGYSTLYGDMAGGLAVLSDVYKTDVYRLSRLVNERLGHEAIPESTLTKPPSAELRPGQQDTDSLPPYDVLDPILHAYLEEALDVDGIAEQTGADRALVRRVLDLVDRNEFKRRQAAPGLRVTRLAFGSGRRMPLVEGWTRG